MSQENNQTGLTMVGQIGASATGAEEGQAPYQRALAGGTLQRLATKLGVHPEVVLRELVRQADRLISESDLPFGQGAVAHALDRTERDRRNLLGAVADLAATQQEILSQLRDRQALIGDVAVALRKHHKAVLQMTQPPTKPELRQTTGYVTSAANVVLGKTEDPTPEIAAKVEAVKTSAAPGTPERGTEG